MVATVDDPIRERPGTVIGPYKLLEEIGEGGMGLVFVAEQQQPVRRKVALKIIKPGMDSRQVIARFEAERQALAMMDHPNIAKVYDGGATPEGRPYFVMELVKGTQITDYCDQHRLTNSQRLQLFLDVCHAVQHAHQKGIIHRDLKPSNTLVSLHDVTPVVKVIDFGIAKATSGRLTERTVYTAMAQMVGTPLYMSPEQAGLSDIDVDTRSDVYSLGVLLYELLTGTTPFDREKLKMASYDEMRRIIREDEPPRPSTRLSTIEQAALSTIAERRGLEPRRLRQQVRGELDWIVMKALEKDRNRRYESASALAADVQRYLQNEPVEASHPSTLYRVRKFAQRNKWRLAMASLLATAATLIVSACVGVWKYQTTKEEFQQRVQGERWVRQHAIPELRRLVGKKNYRDAFELAEQAGRLAPDDPTLAELRAEFSSTWSVRSDPPGATVQWRPDGVSDIEWKSPGATPLAVVVPHGPIHWKLTKNGYATVEGWRGVQETIAHFPLYPGETVPVGMVRVAANQYRKDVGAIDPIEGLSCLITSLTATRSRPSSSRHLWMPAATRGRSFGSTPFSKEPPHSPGKRP